jgi:hypothetical protein
MPDTMTEFRDRAAKEYRAARQAKSEPERSTHQSIGNAYKALAQSEAWLEGRVKPVGDKIVLIRR